MIEIWVEEAGREQHRQSLDEGSYRLGRSPDNEIYIADHNISRHHLQLVVTAERVTVTDLGSTNGVQLNGRRLQPHHPTPWLPQVTLEIGPLTVYQRPLATATPALSSLPGQQPIGLGPTALPGVAGGGLVAHIVSASALPQLNSLGPGTFFAGSDPACAIRLSGADIAAHHCRLSFHNDQLTVTNLDGRGQVLLNSIPLASGQSEIWHSNQPLQIGSAVLYLSLAPAGPQVAGRSAGGSSWRPLLGYAFLGFLGLIVTLFCLVSLTAAVAMQRGQCGRIDFDCLALLLASAPTATATAGPSGPATPTAAPLALATIAPTPTSLPVVIATYAAPLNAGPLNAGAVDCQPGQQAVSVASTGWLDLPFPYQGIEPGFGGTAEQFRLISRRTSLGGRINSFFDHEYPAYPARFAFGWEPADQGDSLVIFTGQRVSDATRQDVTDGYWYSGHPGIDFAPAVSRQETTPVLAAARGVLDKVEIQRDGNHAIQLIHDPDGDGFYQYATIYYHLHNDPYFDAMLALKASGARVMIEAGQRIGTMGNTGNSSGVHLHFEVRRSFASRPTFNRLEAVDPYGFVPSAELAVSPWTQAISLLDRAGGLRERAATPAMEYLWIHPLTAVEETRVITTDCPAPVAQVQPVFDLDVDLYSVIGYSIVHPGFTFLARDDQRNILDYSPTISRREMIIRPEDLPCGIQVDDIFWSFRPPGSDQRWSSYQARRYKEREDGSYLFEEWLNRTGQYILVARQREDCVPPRTRIRLAGNAVAENVYEGAVTITLQAEDTGYPRVAGIAETVYSLDCGANWLLYSGPIVISGDTPNGCQSSDESLEGFGLSPGEFLLLASSRDNNDNTEEPPRQIRFRVQ
jgi:murein DD-endopeptidase MepM/ murein hydrolase activator NlpD